VDSHLRTNTPNIYAVGDVNGGLQLAHVASEEGKIAAENIAGKNKDHGLQGNPMGSIYIPGNRYGWFKRGTGEK